MILTNLSNFRIITYLAGFYIQTYPGFSATAILDITPSLSVPNLISLIVDKYSNNYRSVFFYNYTIFLYNIARMRTQQIAYYSTLVLNDKNLLAQPINFGIPNAFLSNSSFDGNCIIGITTYMYYLFGSGDSFYLSFNATVNPINFLSNYRSNPASA